MAIQTLSPEKLITYTRASLIKGRFGGIVYIVAEVPRNAQKKDSFMLSFVRQSGKRDSSPRFARAIFRKLLFTPPTPERGDLGSLRASHIVLKTKRLALS